jgi:hypothetical protein
MSSTILTVSQKHTNDAEITETGELDTGKIALGFKVTPRDNVWRLRALRCTAIICLLGAAVVVHWSDFSADRPGLGRM